ncbi:MAG: phosphoribosylformylglycinamidine synthase subunit PurL [Patescibacteria group bacterium]
MSDKNVLKTLQEAMSSEHTSYASTKKYLKLLPTKGKYVIQGPGENAGILDLGKGYALTLRIESHNHPSFINPSQGAATGVGGILRDIFTMGARPIGTLDFLRFGTDTNSKKVFEGVVKGISDYGNCIGVPTVGGDIYFDKTYNYNCLVNVAAFGIVKKKNIIYGNAENPGSDLIYVGAKTGRDGIGGAQMASENLDKLNISAVQDADAFLEKLLLEACCELAETDWIEGMQDMGAAGLLCSTTEIAMRGREKTGLNLGTKVYLDKIPKKSERMGITDLLLSESQERMLIVGKKKNRQEILNLFEQWDLEAHVIGEVTNDGKYTLISENKKFVMDFDEIFQDVDKDWEKIKWKTQKSKHKKANKKQTENTWHQYDWTVGTRTIKGPDKSGHHAVVELPEIKKNLIISWSSDEGVSDLSPSRGITHAFYKCFKRIKDMNGIPLGLTNCLNFGHPKASMGAFVETIETLSKICRKENVPIVSGNVSLYNAHKNHSIKPTPILVMVGLQDL